jgi:NAD(P)-dependent dehydrogenase (short-subunit alcohol dehydrogenase family)
VVHAIAFSDKTELTGRFINTSRENFRNSLTISCYSFIDVARRASELMPEGGTLLTLTYQGSNRVTPFYNVMGVAKAALESSVRYLANDLGPQGIRVNAISPGPMKTLAGAAIGGARKTFKPRPRPTRRCAPTPRSRRWAARRSTWPRITGPARRARSSPSMAATTCWGCRSRRTSEDGHGRARLGLGHGKSCGLWG